MTLGIVERSQVKSCEVLRKVRIHTWLAKGAERQLCDKYSFFSDQAKRIHSDDLYAQKKRTQQLISDSDHLQQYSCIFYLPIKMLLDVLLFLLKPPLNYCRKIIFLVEYPFPQETSTQNFYRRQVHRHFILITWHNDI